MNHVLTFSRREGFIYFVAAMTSILLSLWLACRESVVNPDAVCYLLSAEAIGVSGIQGAMKLCGQAAWPFYSALIYGFAQLSQLSYITSAYLLDGLFSCLSVIAFLLIVKELGATRRIMWLAALVILCSHEFISTREYIVRDHGFWAFYLVSLFALLRYARLSNWMNAITWSTSLLLATLFRIEGAFFLLLVPFVAWFIRGFSWKQRALHFCLLNLVTVCLGAIIAMWLVTHPAQSLDKLGRVAEVTTQLQHGVMMIAERFQAMKAALAQHVLTADSSRDAGIVLVLMMLSWYAISVISNLSWIYALLVLYAWKMPNTKPAPNSNANILILLAYVFINVIITFGFLTEHLFLSKRYLIALSLTLMLCVPFAINNLIEKSANLSHRLLLALTALAMAAATVTGVIDFGYSKTYIHQAGDWLAVNSPTHAKIYANDYQLMYYSKHFGFDIFTKAKAYTQINTIAHDQWKQYDYLALRLNKKEHGDTAAILQEINLTPVQVFSNKRGDRVAIYKVPSITQARKPQQPFRGDVI